VKERDPSEETEEEKEARQNRTKQTDLRMQYLQSLVSHELHLQVWKVSKRRMQKREQELKRKDEILTAQLAGMTEYQSLLEKEKENLLQETESLTEMIEQLKLQEAGAVPSAEVAKTPALQERNVALDQEVMDIMKENDELRKERVQLEEERDAVQKELDIYGGDFDETTNKRDEIDVFSSEFLGSLVDRGSLDREAEDAREILLRRIQDRKGQIYLELSEEEEQVRVFQSELVKMKKQMTSVDISAKREDDLISGEKPPQLIALEVKVEATRKSLVRILF
jgi:FtsZ-binding cell division protein ZapB